MIGCGQNQLPNNKLYLKVLFVLGRWNALEMSMAMTMEVCPLEIKKCKCSSTNLPDNSEHSERERREKERVDKRPEQGLINE